MNKKINSNIYFKNSSKTLNTQMTYVASYHQVDIFYWDDIYILDDTLKEKIKIKSLKYVQVK